MQSLFAPSIADSGISDRQRRDVPWAAHPTGRCQPARSVHPHVLRVFADCRVVINLLKLPE